MSRASNYARHIAFCFRNTRQGGYANTARMAMAYLGLHLKLFKARQEIQTLSFKDFDMELDIYSREVAGYWEIFQEDQYLNLAPKKPQQKTVVLDVGANVGFFAIKQALKFKGDLKLIAFEPDPGTYARLQTNVGRIKARTSADIRCVNCAVDTHTGEAKFVRDVSVESHIVEGDSTAPFITVQLTTLDSIVEQEGIQKVDLLKIDVEGHELKVLAGGKKTLQITDNITLEYHQPQFVEEITEILRPYQFQLVHHNEANCIMSFTKHPPAFAPQGLQAVPA